MSSRPKSKGEEDLSFATGAERGDRRKYVKILLWYVNMKYDLM